MRCWILIFGLLGLALLDTHLSIADEPIALPRPGLFRPIEPEDVAKIEGFIAEFEAFSMVERHEYMVTGTLLSTRDRKGREKEVTIEQFSFRKGHDPSTGMHRNATLRQTISSNSDLFTRPGVLTDRTRIRDYLTNDKGQVITTGSHGPGEPRVGSMKDFRARLSMSLAFNPFRASVTGANQVMNGKAMDLSRHSVIRSTMKKIYKQDDRIFVWLSFKGDFSLNEIVVFENGVPIQANMWERLNPSETEFMDYEVTRTFWGKVGDDDNVPIRISAVKNSELSYREMECEIQWKTGKDVSKRLFDENTLYKLSLSEFD